MQPQHPCRSRQAVLPCGTRSPCVPARASDGRRPGGSARATPVTCRGRVTPPTRYQGGVAWRQRALSCSVEASRRPWPRLASLVHRSLVSKRRPAATRRPTSKPQPYGEGAWQEGLPCHDRGAACASAPEPTGDLTDDKRAGTSRHVLCKLSGNSHCNQGMPSDGRHMGGQSRFSAYGLWPFASDQLGGGGDDDPDE